MGAPDRIVATVIVTKTTETGGEPLRVSCFLTEDGLTSSSSGVRMAAARCTTMPACGESRERSPQQMAAAGRSHHG